MARRSSTGSTLGVLLLLIVGSIFVAIQKIVDSVGGITLVVLILGCISAAMLVSWHKKKTRFEELCAKYGDAEIAKLIMGKQFWRGQTSSQLADSLGSPLGIDSNVLKSKTREVWKYDSRGANRYALRITLENDVVVGWDQKS